MRAIAIPSETTEAVVTGLRESHKDERGFHEEAVTRLQAEVKRIQGRLEVIHEDKLDGKITEEFWARKNAEWRRKQIEALAAVERHQNANHLYFGEGARILNLARRTPELWDEQPQDGKRKLLETLLSNCTCDGEILDGCYRKPLCWLAEGLSRPGWYPHGDSNPGRRAENPVS